MKEKINFIFNEFENEKDRLRGKENSIARMLLSTSDITFKLYYSPSLKRRGLCIELQSEYKKMKFEIQSNGFFYKYQENKIYIEEQGEFVSNIFKTFLLDLIPNTEQANNASLYLDTLKRKILEWHDFFQNIQKETLSKDTIKGIFGELLFLKKLVEDNKISNTSCWKGPLRTRSDFVFNLFRIEIKSTTTRNPIKIAISNEIQLETEANGSLLYLCVFQLIENEDGLSLKQLISETEKTLHTNGLDTIDFYKKLELLGCCNEALESSKDYMLKPHSIDFFRVSEEFPKIKKSTIPEGIIDLKYSILFDSIKKFSINYEKIFE